MAVCKEIDVYGEPTIVVITNIRKGPLVVGCLADITFNPHLGSYEVHKIHTDRKLQLRIEELKNSTPSDILYAENQKVLSQRGAWIWAMLLPQIKFFIHFRTSLWCLEFCTMVWQLLVPGNKCLRSNSQIQDYTLSRLIYSHVVVVFNSVKAVHSFDASLLFFWFIVNIKWSTCRLVIHD